MLSDLTRLLKNRSFKFIAMMIKLNSPSCMGDSCDEKVKVGISLKDCLKDTPFLSL